MTLAAGYETNLLTGLAVALAAAGLEITYPAATGGFTSLQTGLFVNKIPQSPDRVVSLSSYGVKDDPTLSDTITGVQVRTRAQGEDPRPVYDLDSAIFGYLQGKTAWTLSTGILVVEIHRNSGPALLGQDENKRWMLSSNYYATCWRPGTNRG